MRICIAIALLVFSLPATAEVLYCGTTMEIVQSARMDFSNAKLTSQKVSAQGQTFYKTKFSY